MTTDSDDQVAAPPAVPPNEPPPAELWPELWPEIEPASARRLAIGATRAFAERGFHATTTRDIAERAGLSAGGLYVHFQSKEELLFQISLVGHRRALAVMTAAARSTADPVDRLRAVVRDFASWHAEKHEAARIIQYELGALTAEHLTAVAEVRRDIDRVMRETIQAGVAAGHFDTPDLAGTALALLSLCIDVARWYTEAYWRSPATIGELYADLAVRMLRISDPDAGTEPKPEPEPEPK